MAINKNKIVGFIKIVLLIYASAGIALFYFQDKFLFHPKKLAPGYQFKFDGKFEEMSVPFNEEDTMNLIKFFPENKPSRGVVIYYHGNMNNVEHYAAFTKPFTKNGYEVWMEDYPGFGKSTGEITEKKLYDQAFEVKRMADAKFGTDSIIIYGKSLGTGIAANIASRAKAKILILETPYHSIPSLFSSYAFMYPNEMMSNYKIPTHSFLEDVVYPIIIFHGTKDRVIPLRCAKKLTAALKKSDKFIIVDGATHQDINTKPVYYSTIDSLLK